MEVLVEVVFAVPNVDIPVPGARVSFGYEVLEVSSQNRVLLRLLLSRSLTLQFQGVVFLAVELLKVFTQDNALPSSSVFKIWRLLPEEPFFA